MVGPGQPIRPFWVRWWRGEWWGGWDGEVVELDRCGLLFSKQAPFFFLFFFFSSAITSIMAIQRAKQAILQWTVWARF